MPAMNDASQKPAKRSSWPLMLILLVGLLGLGLLFGGFAYDVMFAGIPYQDPTPELAQSYARNARIASYLMRAGLGLMGLSVVSRVIWSLAGVRNRRGAKP